MEITRAGSKPSDKGPGDCFTGTLRIDPLLTAPAPAGVGRAAVTFEPGRQDGLAHASAWSKLNRHLRCWPGAGGCRSVEEIRPGNVVGPAMAQERMLISADWGKVNAELADNNAARALFRMLPLTIEMRDHVRQEKTGNLPSPLPAVERQLDFSAGTLGLWSSDHFVIYYRDGRVPQPGIALLGRATGDVSIFDRPGPVTVGMERIR